MRSSIFLLSTAAALPALLWSSHAASQTITLDPPPIRLPLDDQAVDLATGAFVPPSVSFSIGGAGSGLTHQLINVNGGWSHNYMLTVKSGPGSSRIVTVGGISRTFTLVGSVWTSDQQEGETLTQSGTLYILTTKDGTQVTFDTSLINGVNNYYGSALAVGTQIKDPDGKIKTLTYKGTTYQKEIKSGFFITMHVLRLQSVNSSTGYQLKFSYFADSIFDEFEADYWILIASVKGINNAVEYCDPSADYCTLTGDWPSISYLNSTSGTDKLLTITDKAGHQTRFRRNNLNRITGIKRPSESADGLVVSYDTAAHVQAVTHVGSPSNYVRNYTWTTGTGTLIAVSTDSLGRTRTTTASTTQHVILNDKNANNQVTTYTPDTYGRITTVEAPEHNKIITAYGARGNVSSVTRRDKSGTLSNDIVTSATYPATCTTPYTVLNCNLPLTTTDERGNVTNYSWSPMHGQLLSVTSPPDANSVRPEIRYTYTGEYAYYHNGASTWISSSAPIYKPTSVSSCRVATSGSPSSCVGTADERVTTIGYPGSTTANNVQPSSITNKTGNNTLTSMQTLAYDSNGQFSTIDGPLSGTDDKVQIRYDSIGQIIGRIGPDPDGAGGNPRVAERLTYNVDGQVTATEIGTVADLTDTAWGSFSPTQKSVTGYDGFGRVTTEAQVATSGTTQYSLTQTTYDAAGRKDCVAVRMNAPLTTTALPASACTAMSAGSYGEDRINQWEYNAVDQVTKVHSGVGTAIAQVTAELSYNSGSTQNGTLNWAEDANGNRTGYVYDGFDRNTQINYPSGTTTHTVNSGDNELYGFDRSGNITSFRTRRGDTLTLTYDNLNRLTYKAIPYRSDLTVDQRRPVEYSYDLQGNLLSAGFDGTSGGQAVLFTYDALGRKLTETQVMDGASRTITSAYDAANSLTRLTHPDGNFVDYNRYSAGTFYYSDINGSPLIYPTYDSLGRMANLYRLSTATANWGPATSFSYYNISRLSSYSFGLNTSSYNSTTTFGYNPASQITSRVSNNDAYAWTAANPVSRPYVPNGLNQYASVNSVSQSYDANGNLTSDGSSSYVYDIENRMVSATVGGATTTLRYDPLGRLYEIAGTSGSHRLLYDGDDLVLEYTSDGTIAERYVHGVGTGDDPLVWFEGYTVADSARRYLYADERGSIVAVTDSSGNVVNVNTYDEYGIPGASNVGRFQYTGQAFIPEIGMYYYKARMYSPTLGRFMQTDPIGYGDGMNMYRYVGNDPVNLVDPTGLREILKYCYYPPAATDGSITVWGAPICSYTDLGSDQSLFNDRRPHDLFDDIRGNIDAVSKRLDDLAANIASSAQQFACSLPSVSVGGGADGYAGVGASISGSFNLDVAHGRFGVSGGTGVGIGLGIDAGPNLGAGPSGGDMVSLNLAINGAAAAPVAPGVNVGASGTYNILGTDAGFSGGGVGRAGTPMANVNVGANFGFSTPSLYDLHC